MSIWVRSVLSLVSGVVLWEAIKFIYPEIKKWIVDKSAARNGFLENIAPILKSADELYGKIVSSGKRGFFNFY